VKALADAAEGCWKAIMAKDLKQFAFYFNRLFEAQVKIFPAMLPPEVKKIMDEYKPLSLAQKLAGAGGGGYLVLVHDAPLDETIRITVRKNYLHL